MVGKIHLHYVKNEIQLLFNRLLRHQQYFNKNVYILEENSIMSNLLYWSNRILLHHYTLDNK